MEFKWLVIMVVSLVFCGVFGSVGIKYFENKNTDPLAQQIRAIEDVYADRDQKAELVKQLIEKYNVSTNVVKN